jgi:biotin carboxyl carrier protein
MKVEAKVKNKTNLKKVKDKTQKANFESIKHTVATIRKTALNSIRKGRKKDRQRVPSVPGKAPKTWDNKSGRAIKRTIGFTTASDIYGRSVGTVYAIPLKPGDLVYRMLEEGGSQYIEVLRNSSVVDDRSYRRSRQRGWWFDHYKPMEQRSEGQQRHIEEYYDNIKRLKNVKRKVRARYEARPFLMPAVQKNLSRIPSIWRSAIGMYFR